MVARVVHALRTLLATVPTVKLALENMIRQAVCGRSWSLRTLKRILDEVGSPRVQVCVDICHAHIAEYDLRSPAGLEGMMRALRDIGQERIAGFHVSDSSTRHGRACEGHAKLVTSDPLTPASAMGISRYQRLGGYSAERGRRVISRRRITTPQQGRYTTPRSRRLRACAKSQSGTS